MHLDVIFAFACSLLLGGAALLQKSGIDARGGGGGEGGKGEAGDKGGKGEEVWRGWRSVARSRVWRAGVAMELVADGLFLLAVLTPGARIVVIQPIVILHFAVAMALGVTLLGERLSRRDGVAAGLLAMGGALVALRGSQEGAVEPASMLGGLALAVVCAAFVAGALVVGRMLRGARGAEGGRAREVMFATLAGLGFSVSVVASKVASFDYRQRFGWPPVWEALRWGVTTPAPLLMVTGNLLGFGILQAALRHGRVSVVSPIVALVSLIVPVAVSLSAMGESLSWLTAAGGALVVMGLVLLSMGAFGERA